MRRRSNLMVLLGVAFFIVGAAIVYLVVANDDDGGGGSSGNANGADTVDVVVAKEALTAGQDGNELVAQGKVEIQRVRLVDKQPDALTTQSQLSGQVLTLAFTPGEQIRFGGLKPASVLSVPDGFEAVAVTLDPVAAGGGFINPGDKVNVFAVLNPFDEVVPSADQVNEAVQGENGATQLLLPYAVPRVELLLTNIEVLAVGATTAAQQAQGTANTTDQRAATAEVTYVLAVDTLDAEKLIFQSSVSTNKIYFSRVNDDAQPAQPTNGQDFFTILVQEAIDAYNRTHPQ